MQTSLYLSALPSMAIPHSARHRAYLFCAPCSGKVKAHVPLPLYGTCPRSSCIHSSLWKHSSEANAGGVISENALAGNGQGQQAEPHAAPSKQAEKASSSACLARQQGAMWI